MKISGEQFKKHFKEINEFLENQNYIKDLYHIKGLETKLSTKNLLDDNLIEPFKLNAAVIQYLVFSSADKEGAKTKDHHYSMMLIAAYIQGVFTSYDLYSEGSYIKAAAVLKQDFEIMVRLNEIYKKRHKDGNTPNAQNGPKEAGKVYGYLNNVAHIAKQDILEQLMTYTTDEKSGFSPVKAKKANFFTTVKPMLATLVDKPFDDDNWLYEVKWDGYRAVSFMHNKTIEIKSRNDNSFNEKYYPVLEAMKAWGIDAVVDGEIVVVGKEGQANFSALQNWRSEADGELLFYAFDILWYNGCDLKGLPLIERKAILEKLVPKNSLIQYSKNFETSGIEFLEAAKRLGLEGIMAKRKDSLYETGNRTKDWLKIKANKRQEVVIGGYTKNEGTKKPFSSLLVGVFEKGKFIYTGKIGTGINIKLQQELLEQFKPFIIDKPAFTETPDINKPSRFRPDPPKAKAVWLKPELICEVSFAEMTNDGVMRHPSFQGMRDDKNAKDVVLEKEVATKRVVKGNSSDSADSEYIASRTQQDRKTLLNPTEETQVKKINSHEVKFTNLSKVFWPKDQVTKRDLINYYYQVAPFILPYLKDRPQSLNRFPNGIDGKGFYQKDVTGKVPDWMKTYLYHSDADDRDRHYLVGNDEATLLSMAGMGCIEMNPWSSTVKKPDYPTWCIIDLDPDKNSFNQVIEAAQVTHQILESMGIESYCKTSGSTGLHIYIPLGGKYTYEQSKEFGQLIVTMVHEEIPKYTSIERMISNRDGKMYLDFLQNRPHATIAAPYSLRPKPGATVSMPLRWDELRRGLKMSDFTIFNAIERVKANGDIFQPVLGKGVNLKTVLHTIGKEK